MPLLDVDVVTFDFDGTLVDSNQIKYQSYFGVIEEFDNSKAIMEDILSNHIEFTRFEVFQEFVDRIGKIRNTKELTSYLVKKYSLLCEEQIVQAPEIKGTTEILSELSKKKHIFISSATPITSLMPLIERRGLNKYVEAVFGAPEKKQDHLRTIYKKCQCSGEKVVYIGDSEADRRAAEKAKCSFIGLGLSTDRFNTAPDIQIPNLLGLRGIIL
jgi:phosphoglycolate phosphatase